MADHTVKDPIKQNPIKPKRRRRRTKRHDLSTPLGRRTKADHAKPSKPGKFRRKFPMKGGK